MIEQTLALNEMSLNRLLYRSSPRKRVPACSSVVGTNPAVVVPAQAGTHNHHGFDYRRPCHIALLRRMGPRLRGDDSGESLPHIHAGGNRADERD